MKKKVIVSIVGAMMAMALAAPAMAADPLEVVIWDNNQQAGLQEIWLGGYFRI